MLRSVIFKICTILFPSLSGLLFRLNVDLAGIIFVCIGIVFAILDVIFNLLYQIKKKYLELNGINKALYHLCNFNQDHDVRLMLYKPLDKKCRILKPVAPYHPETSNNIIDEKMGSFKYGIPLGKGAVGKAAETKDVVSIKLSPNKCIEDLLKEHKFKKEEIEKLSKDRKSYLAIPFYNRRKNIKGVIYLDSNNCNTFNNEIIEKVTHMSKLYYNNIKD